MPLYSSSYPNLLGKALRNNIKLQLASKNQKSILLRGEIQTRYQNPNVEFELSRFSNTQTSKTIGGRIGVNQELLLPSVRKNKNAISRSKFYLSKAQSNLDRAVFSYRFAMAYLDYKEALGKERLQKLAIKISSNIFKIANQRFKHGSIAKSEWLQAKLDHSRALRSKDELKMMSLEAKHRFLSLGNLRLNTYVDTSYKFKKSYRNSIHPLIKLNQKREELAYAKLKLASNTIEKISLFSDVENEVNQNIVRFGISIPLPMSNKKSQEKQLAKIAINTQQMKIQNQRISLKIKIRQIKEENRALKRLKSSYYGQIKEQKNLLNMYQKAYSLAQINILKLNSTKQNLLESKVKLFEAKSKIERNILKINYLQGGKNG